jgi:hypothetical protein
VTVFNKFTGKFDVKISDMLGRRYKVVFTYNNRICSGDIKPLVQVDMGISLYIGTRENDYRRGFD